MKKNVKSDTTGFRPLESTTCSPCPICGNENVRAEYDALRTSQKGIDRQTGWVECANDECNHSSEGVTAVGNDTDDLAKMVYSQWEDHCKSIFDPNAKADRSTD